MLRWIKNLVNAWSTSPERIERPPPLVGTCDRSLDDPALEPARTMTHDAANVLAGLKGKRDLARRRALRRDPFLHVARELFGEAER